MGKTLCLLLSLILASVIAMPVKAMDFGTVFQEAEIGQAILSPTNEKGVSILQLRLTNLALGNLTIIGVKSAHHDNSKIVAELEPEKFVTLETLSIPAEETLDMMEAGIFVHLLNMKAPVNADGMVELRLVLTQGELPFMAHIEP